MKIKSPAIVNPYVAAMLSAVFFVGAWPAIGSFAPLIFVAFVPLFLIHFPKNNRQISRMHLVVATTLSFFLWNAGTLYFLFLIDGHIGIKLLAFLTPVWINTIWMTLLMLFCGQLAKHRGVVTGLVVFVLSWLSVEWLQHHWALAFPWLTLGNVMAPYPAYVQWYSITGVAGGSLWVLLANVLIFVAVTGSRKYGLVAGTVLFFPILLNLADTEIDSVERERFSIVQPCLSNTAEKFNGEMRAQHISRSFSALKDFRDSVGVIVFPETYLYEPAQISGPPDDLKFEGLWLQNPENSDAVRQMRKSLKHLSWSGLITGAFARKYYSPDEPAPAYADVIPGLEARAENYNSALILDENSFAWRHKKMLVAGVEQIPFASSVSVFNHLALDLGGVVGSLGKQEELQPVKVGKSLAGTQICYDSAFGWISAELARKGANVLVVITNDSWWGDSPGYRQLLSFAQLRAIETGRWVVRSANKGISALIAPNGNMVNYLPWNEQGVISAEVTLYNHTTFYSRHGDFIYKGAAGLLFFMLLFLLMMKKGRTPSKTIS